MTATEISKLLLDYASRRNWSALFAVGVVVTVWFVRDIAMRDRLLGRFRWLAFLKTDLGGWLLAVATGISGGLLTTLKAGVPIDKQIILAGALNGVLASGLFVGANKAIKAAAKKPKPPIIRPPRQDDQS